MDSRSVLEQVRSGKLSVAEAESYFNRKAYENLNYARLDTSREQRTGFAEVVYCSGKPDAYLADIYKRLLVEQGEVFGTRATPEQYELVRRQLPDIVYDPVARTLKQERSDKECCGCVVVCTAGTADIPVAEEGGADGGVFRDACGEALRCWRERDSPSFG